jgi:hypothetical protein
VAAVPAAIHSFAGGTPAATDPADNGRPRRSVPTNDCRCYVASYRIRPQFSQLTISFPALTRIAVSAVTFM